MANLLIGFVLLSSSYTMDCSAADDVAAPTSDDPPPVVVEPNAEWPFSGALATRLWCIEGLESRHDPYAVNHGSGAKGLLQWLDSTARAWGVQVGNRQSEWNAAADIHAHGEIFFRSQWPVTARLCP